MSSPIIVTQSTLVTITESDVKNNENRVLLKVRFTGREADTTYYYWISRNTSFRELILDYSRRFRAYADQLRFQCNGSPIFHYESADVYKLQDGDSIDVTHEGYFTTGTETTLITLPRSKSETPVTLKLAAIGIDRYLLYLLGRNTPLEILFRHFVDRTSRVYETTRFYVRTRNDGCFLDPKKTADDYKFKDGDIIRAESLSSSSISGSIDVKKRGIKVTGAETTLVSLTRIKGEMPITLKVGRGYHRYLLYLIGRNTPLEKLFVEYELRTFSMAYEHNGFYITRNNEDEEYRIDPEKTADDLKMEDGDFIRSAIIDLSYDYSKQIVQ